VCGAFHCHGECTSQTDAQGVQVMDSELTIHPGLSFGRVPVRTVWEESHVEQQGGEEGYK